MSISKIKVEDVGFVLDDEVIVERFNLGSDKVWKRNIPYDASMQRTLQRLVEDRLSHIVTNGVVHDRSASAFQSPMTFSITVSPTIHVTDGKVILNGRLLQIGEGDIDLSTLTNWSSGDGDYYLYVWMDTSDTLGDSFKFDVQTVGSFTESNPTHRNNKVRIATYTISGGGGVVQSISAFNEELVPNVYNEAITQAKMNTNDLATHDHTSATGHGGLLSMFSALSNLGDLIEIAKYAHVASLTLSVGDVPDGRCVAETSISLRDADNILLIFGQGSCDGNAMGTHMLYHKSSAISVDSVISGATRINIDGYFGNAIRQIHDMDGLNNHIENASLMWIGKVSELFSPPPSYPQTEYFQYSILKTGTDTLVTYSNTCLIYVVQIRLKA